MPEPLVITRPLRLELQHRLTELLEGMDTSDGYVIDLGSQGEPAHDGDMTDRVFRGRAVYGTSDPLPMLSILEVPIPLEQNALEANPALTEGDWELMIQGFVRDDKDNPTDPAHILMADVKQCLALECERGRDRFADPPGILGLQAAIESIAIAPGVVRPPDEVSAKAYFWLTITVKLNEDLTKPYRA